MFVGFSFPPGEASIGPAALAKNHVLESRILKFCRHSPDAQYLAVAGDDLQLQGTVYLVLCSVLCSLSPGRALLGDGLGIDTSSLSAGPRRVRSRQSGAAG